MLKHNRAVSSSILRPGYGGNQLIMGVVASCHMATNAWYVWSRDGAKIKEGNKCCCLTIKAPGSYSVEVHCGEQEATSEPVLVCPLREMEPSGLSITVPSTSANQSHAILPVVEKKEIQFSTKDVIGRGRNRCRSETRKKSEMPSVFSQLFKRK